MLYFCKVHKFTTSHKVKFTPDAGASARRIVLQSVTRLARLGDTVTRLRADLYRCAQCAITGYTNTYNRNISILRPARYWQSTV